MNIRATVLLFFIAFHSLGMQYNYLDFSFINSLIQMRRQYFLVASGLPEFSLNAAVNKEHTQKSSFTMFYLLMNYLWQKNAYGRLVYLTASPISKDYRRYLFLTANKNLISHQKIIQSFEDFDEEYLAVQQIDVSHQDKNAQESGHYLIPGTNVFARTKILEEINRAKRDMMLSTQFVGLTGHFTGQTLENMAKDLNLPYLPSPTSLYPHEDLRLILGEEKLKNRYIKSYDEAEIPKISLQECRNAIQKKLYIEFLPNHPLNLNLNTSTGCIIYNDTFRLGKIGLACSGTSTENAEFYYDQMLQSINNYLKSLPEYSAYLKFYSKYKKRQNERLLNRHFEITKESPEQLLENYLFKSQHETLWQGITRIHFSFTAISIKTEMSIALDIFSSYLA